MSEKSEVIVTSDQILFDPKEFDRFLEKRMVKASEGKEPQKTTPRSVGVLIPIEMCRPHSFSKDIRINVTELSPRTEEEIMRKTNSPGMDGVFLIALAKRAIWGMNGRRLEFHEVDMVWEEIGMSGRMAVLNAYLEHCTGIEEVSLKKSFTNVAIE
jgi:hypothetical protein